MKFRISFVAAALVLNFAFANANVTTQAGNENGSLRIILSVANNVWTLESVTQIAGPAPDQSQVAKGRFSIILQDAGQNTIYQSYLGHPDLLFYDFPDTSGDLNGGVIERDTFAVTCMIPFDSQVERMLINDEKGLAGFSADRGELERVSKVQRVQLPIFSLDTLRWSGTSADNLDIVILGDGFTINDTATFYSFANTVFLSQVLLFSPFSAYSDRINVYAINTISLENGADHPDDNIFRDTYYNSYYINGRLIIVPGSKPFTVCTENIPDWDQVWMLVDDPVYGGAGGEQLAVSYIGDVRVLIHEFGHSFAQLSDEYSYGGTGPDADYINCDDVSVNPIWQRWIDAGEPLVGAYRPCTYDNLYAPTNGVCIMRRLGPPFCAICQERIVNRLYDYAPNPVRATSPEPVFSFEPGAIQQFSVDYANQFDYPLELTWTVDGIVYPESTGTSFTLALESDKSYLVKVLLYDSTSMVLNMADSTLTTTCEWIAVPANSTWCGDADTNNMISISDAVYLIQYIFAGGPAPIVMANGDVNCDTLVNISDAVYLIGYIFSAGPAPCSAC